MKIVPSKELLIRELQRNAGLSNKGWEDQLDKFPNWRLCLPLDFKYKNESLMVENRTLYIDSSNEVSCYVKLRKTSWHDGEEYIVETNEDIL